jgi:hypothetical protein
MKTSYSNNNDKYSSRGDKHVVAKQLPLLPTTTGWISALELCTTRDELLQQGSIEEQSINMSIDYTTVTSDTTFPPVLPAIKIINSEYDIVNINESLYKIIDMWIWIMQRLNTITATTANLEGYANENTINNNSGNNTNYHAKVYHRLATLLLTLARLIDDNETHNNHMDQFQMIRSYAQSILKVGRMKGVYGATHYYVWFTAIAAESSEVIGDSHIANLAYRSINKLQHQEKREGTHNVMVTLYDSGNDDANRVQNRNNHNDDPLTTWSDNIATLNRNSNRGMKTLTNNIGPNIPSSLENNSMKSIGGSSLLGNRWVRPGSLQERIVRTHNRL